MKNLPYAWLGVLTIAIAFLFYQNSGSSSAGLGASTADGRSIVFVNSDSLLTNYQFYKDAQKEFENKGYRLQVDLGQKERALQAELQAIQQTLLQGIREQ